MNRLRIEEKMVGTFSASRRANSGDLAGMSTCIGFCRSITISHEERDEASGDTTVVNVDCYYQGHSQSGKLTAPMANGFFEHVTCSRRSRVHSELGMEVRLQPTTIFIIAYVFQVNQENVI